MLRKELADYDVPEEDMSDERIHNICCGDDEDYPDIREGEFVPLRFDWEIEQIEVE